MNADDKNYWLRVEDYVSANADVRFSHGICPNCYKTEVEPQLAQAGITPIQQGNSLDE